MSYEYNVLIPESDRTLFRQWARKMGWGISRPRKVEDVPNKQTMDAVEEIRNGGGTRCNSFEDYLEAVTSI